MIEQIGLSALFSAFIILFATKIGLLEQIQMRSNATINEMIDCKLCLSFWVNMTYATIYMIWLLCFNQPIFTTLMIPFLAAPITRKLI
jgi:hypothetical protein